MGWRREGGGGGWGGAFGLVATVSMMTVHRDTMCQMSLTHNDGEIINVCILK